MLIMTFNVPLLIMCNVLFITCSATQQQQMNKTKSERIRGLTDKCYLHNYNLCMMILVRPCRIILLLKLFLSGTARETYRLISFKWCNGMDQIITHLFSFPFSKGYWGNYNYRHCGEERWINYSTNIACILILPNFEKHSSWSPGIELAAFLGSPSFNSPLS